MRFPTFPASKIGQIFCVRAVDKNEPKIGHPEKFSLKISPPSPGPPCAENVAKIFPSELSLRERQSGT